jgi:hypothetical protein
MLAASGSSVSWKGMALETLAVNDEALALV